MSPPALRLLCPIECVTTAAGDVIRPGRKPQALPALIAAHGSDTAAKQSPPGPNKVRALPDRAHGELIARRVN